MKKQKKTMIKIKEHCCVLYRLSIVFLKADVAAVAAAAAVGDVGVSGGVDTPPHLNDIDDLTSASVSTLSVRSSGRPDATSPPRDVMRRSTASSIPLPVWLDDESMSDVGYNTDYCRLCAAASLRAGGRRRASARSAPLQLAVSFEARETRLGYGGPSAGVVCTDCKWPSATLDAPTTDHRRRFLNTCRTLRYIRSTRAA